MGNRGRAVLLVALIVCSAVVYLVGNGSVALWDRDEPRYAETSRQMLQSGDWVVPHYLDKPRTAKPALIYWCQAVAMKWFGDNAFAARFPSALATVILLIVLGAVLWRPLGAELTLWTVFIFATSGLTIAAAKMCITDAVLLLWVTVAQICFFAIWRGNRSWKVVVTFWLAIGLAGLTKGPVILGILATTALALTLFEGEWGVQYLWRRHELESSVALTGLAQPWRRWTATTMALGTAVELTILWRARALKSLRWLRSTRPAIGLLIVLAVVLPWMAMVQLRATGFLLAGFRHDVWDRMMTPLEQHVGPPGYYFLTIWITFFPWSLLLPLAIGVAIGNLSDSRVRFALSAIIGPWIMLECVRTKLPHYFLPVFPPLAYLTADALVRCLRGEIADLRSRTFIIVVGVWAVLVALAASGPWIFIGAPLPMPVHAMIALSVLGILFPLTVFLAFKARRLARAAISMGIGTFAFVCLTYLWYLPDASFLRLSERLAQILVDHHVTQPHQVMMLQYMEPSLAFAQGGTIREAGDLGFSKKFEPKLTPWLVVPESVWDKAPPDLRADYKIVRREFGLVYADHGKWMWVLVIHRREMRGAEDRGSRMED